MIDRFAGWLRRVDAAPAEDARPGPEDMRLAACALLVETARMDGRFDDDERATVERLIAARFALPAAEAAALVADAERAVAASPQIFRFTNAVKTHFDERERAALFEMLWEVAYADGEVHEFEENLLRRIGGLIYVSDRDRGAARRRARERRAAAERSAEPPEGDQTR